MEDERIFVFKAGNHKREVKKYVEIVFLNIFRDF